MENWNRSITDKDIESAIKTPAKKSAGPDGFTGEFHQTFKEEITPVIPRLFAKTAVVFILQGQHHLDIRTRQGH